MADFSNNTITIEGRKLLVESLTNGTGIEFTHFAIGDGAAPEAPENLAALVHELFTVAISKTQESPSETGVTLVRGGFTNSAEKGDFYWRELGLYARTAGTTNAPILFGYTHAGATADYIPSVDVGSIIEQAILLQVVTGSAQVLYVSDPTAKATLQDIDDCIAEVEARLEAFTQEHLDSIRGQVEELQASIDAAAAALEKAAGGYVNKTGDTMTGNLDMGQNKVIGDLDGSATKWNGWRAFDSLEELNAHSGTTLTVDSPELDIINAMPSKSRFLRVTAGDTPFRVNGQQVWGMMEIFKPADYFCELLISGSAGQRYRCSWDTTVGLTPWVSEIGTPAGIIDTYAGATAPLGYLLCHGQSVSTTTYSALFAAIGYTYGGSGDKFNLPDLRGVFLRGHDAGRGIDSGRKLGTQQQSGAPNITGDIKGAPQDYAKWDCSGAFQKTYDSEGYLRGGGGGYPAGINVSLDASRSSGVYQNGLKEVRPVNVAINYIIKY